PNKGGPMILPGPTTGYLGIQMEPATLGIKVARVEPKTPAADVGIKSNDIILSVNGESATEPEGFIELMVKYKVGDVVTLKVKRGDEELEVKPKLGRRPPNNSDMQNSWGSQLSSRRSGYPTILQHDSVIRPADCGGPLVDLEGHVLGINVC